MVRQDALAELPGARARRGLGRSRPPRARSPGRTPDLKKKEARVADLLECCSPGMTRTCDPMINSHLLCQLSYWGMTGARILRRDPLGVNRLRARTGHRSARGRQGESRGGGRGYAR